MPEELNLNEVKGTENWAVNAEKRDMLAKPELRVRRENEVRLGQSHLAMISRHRLYQLTPSGRKNDTSFNLVKGILEVEIGGCRR